MGPLAPDPPADDKYGTMAKYADEIAGLLGVADDRQKAMVHICKTVEEQNAAALKRARKRGLF